MNPEFDKERTKLIQTAHLSGINHLAENLGANDY